MEKNVVLGSALAILLTVHAWAQPAWARGGGHRGGFRGHGHSGSFHFGFGHHFRFGHPFSFGHHGPIHRGFAHPGFHPFCCPHGFQHGSPHLFFFSHPGESHPGFVHPGDTWHPLPQLPWSSFHEPAELPPLPQGQHLQPGAAAAPVAGLPPEAAATLRPGHPPSPAPESIPPPPPGAATGGRGAIRLDVHPPEAQIFFDRWYLGRAGELGTIGGLPSGHHVVEIRMPESRTFIGVDTLSGAVSLVREDVTAGPAPPADPAR